MRTEDRPCVFDPSTNTIVDLLRPGESEVEALIRLAQHGLDLIVLPLGEAWRRHEDAAKRPPAGRAPGRTLGTHGAAPRRMPSRRDPSEPARIGRQPLNA